MNKTNGYQRLGSESFSPSEHSFTQAVILYQDDSTHRWAEETYAQLGAVDPTRTIRATWWNLADMAQPGVLAGAVSTAIRADLVVIATGAETGLPLPFYVWAAAWLPNRGRVGGSLLALLDRAQHSNHNSPPVLEYLRTLSRQAGLAFFCEQRLSAQSPAVLQPKPTFKRSVNGRPASPQLAAVTA